MKGFGIVLPLLATGFVAANPVEKRQLPQGAASPQEQQPLAITAQLIQQNVHMIDTGIYNLRKDLKNYQGGQLSETPLGVDLIGIHDANRKGYADATARTEAYSAADSKAIVDYLHQTVSKDFPAAINELKAKKALFQGSGQDALIVASLKSLLYDHDTFSAAVTKLLTGKQEDAYNAALSVHNAIQNGIDYFGDANAGVAKEGLRVKRDAWGQEHGSGSWEHGNSGSWGQGHKEPEGGWPQAPTPSQTNWKPAPTPSQANWGPNGNSGSWGNRGGESGWGNKGGQASGWGSHDEGRHIKRDAAAQPGWAGHEGKGAGENWGQGQGWGQQQGGAGHRPTPSQANWGAPTPSQANWGNRGGNWGGEQGGNRGGSWGGEQHKQGGW